MENSSLAHVGVDSLGFQSARVHSLSDNVSEVGRPHAVIGMPEFQAKDRSTGLVNGEGVNQVAQLVCRGFGEVGALGKGDDYVRQSVPTKHRPLPPRWTRAT